MPNPAGRKRRRKTASKRSRPPPYDDIIARIAANTRRLRASRGWTQDEAAYRCDDMQPYQYRCVENFATNVTARTLARLCVGFEVDVGEFFLPAPPPPKRRRGRPSVASDKPESTPSTPARERPAAAGRRRSQTD